MRWNRLERFGKAPVSHEYFMGIKCWERKRGNEDNYQKVWRENGHQQVWAPFSRWRSFSNFTNPISDQLFPSPNLIPNFFVEHLQKTKDLSKNLNLENVTPERIFYTNTVCGVCNKYKVCWWGGHTWRRVCGQFNAPPVVHPGMHLALS